MKIICKAEQKQEIKDIIQTESDKRGFDIFLLETSDCIICTELAGDYCLIQEIDEAADSCRDMLAIIKNRFPDVRIEGGVEIGNKNYRNTYIFESPEQSQVVTAESTLEYLDDVPSSECWFSDCVNGNYGPETVGFATREEFEKFIEFTRGFREDHGLTFEEFIQSDLLESLFDEESEDYSAEASEKFPLSIWPDELHDLYISAWKQYQKEVFDSCNVEFSEEKQL